MVRLKHRLPGRGVHGIRSTPQRQEVKEPQGRLGHPHTVWGELRAGWSRPRHSTSIGDGRREGRIETPDADRRRRHERIKVLSKRLTATGAHEAGGLRCPTTTGGDE